MAHKHTALETIGCERGRGYEMSHPDNFTLCVDDLRLTVNDVGVGIGMFSQPAQCVLSGKAVACVEEYEKFAFGKPDALVHGVIQPLVGLGVNDRLRNAGVSCQLKSAIPGCSINYEMLKVAEVLFLNAVKGGLYHTFCIESNCNDTE